MDQFGEYIKMAIDNILSNKGRSLLTMLGIIIGIASVITVVSVGMGVKNDVQKETSATPKSVTINAKKEEVSVELITYEDLKTVKEQLGEQILGAVFSSDVSGTVQSRKGEYTTYMTLTTPDIQKNPNMNQMLKGSFFSEDDMINQEKVCVLDKSGARLLFGNTDIIGMECEVTVGGSIQTFRVVGVLDLTEQQMEDERTSVELFGYSQYVTMYVPYTVSTALGKTQENFSSMTFYPTDPEQGKRLAKLAVNILTSRHLSEGRDVFQKQKDVDLSAMMGTALNAVTGFVALVAGISLLVGGIGVMNIMLVSVTERTREIGIRKALGAKTNSIITQFLFESAIISGLGGIIGVVLGIVIAKVIAYAVPSASALISWQVVVIATVFSCGVGIVFGIYPAKKAAKMSPIDALRQM